MKFSRWRSPWRSANGRATRSADAVFSPSNALSRMPSSREEGPEPVGKAAVHLMLGEVDQPPQEGGRVPVHRPVLACADPLRRLQFIGLDCHEFLEEPAELIDVMGGERPVGK